MFSYLFKESVCAVIVSLRSAGSFHIARYECKQHKQQTFNKCPTTPQRWGSCKINDKLYTYAQQNACDNAIFVKMNNYIYILSKNVYVVF